MSQPPPYTRKANFTQYAAENAAQPVAATSLDLEFNAILATLSVALANLALIQRDDGALRNGSVSIDTLRPDVLLVLGASSQWALRGAWQPDISYLESDVVVEGTRTLAASSAHVSDADIETDIAAGRWTLIFDAGGSVPADGSVTTAKLADDAVTEAKLGLTDLTLTGFMKAVVGFAAGTAASGSLFHAKLDSGPVVLHAERKTAAQGIVGVKLTGVTGGANWNMEMASNAVDLTFRHSTGGIALSVNAAGNVDAPGGIRSTGSVLPTAGQGVLHRFASNTGYSEAYDYTASAWRDYKVRGRTVTFAASGVDVAVASSTGLAVTGALLVDGKDIRDLPKIERTGASQLTIADRGRMIVLNNATAVDMTIPANATVALPPETFIVLFNDGAGLQTIKPAADVTLVFAGTGATGDRTLGSKGMATLWQIEANRWIISGVGVA